MSEEQGKYGYIAMYRGKRIEVRAHSSYGAQAHAARIFKAKRASDVDVYLAETPEGEVTNVAH